MKDLDCSLLFSFSRQSARADSASKFWLPSDLGSNISSVFKYFWCYVASQGSEWWSTLYLTLKVCGMLFRLWATHTHIGDGLRSAFLISVCSVAFLSFSGYLRSPSWPFSQKAWALFSLLCCLLSITPSASRAMQQKDTEKNGDFPTAPGVIALLVRERIPLPPQSFRHLPGHCCHHYASLTILLGGWGRREGKKYEKKKKQEIFSTLWPTGIPFATPQSRKRGSLLKPFHARVVHASGFWGDFEYMPGDIEGKNGKFSRVCWNSKCSSPPPIPLLLFILQSFQSSMYSVHDLWHMQRRKRDRRQCADSILPRTGTVLRGFNQNL